MFPSCVGRFLKRIQSITQEDQRCACCDQTFPAAETLTAPCLHIFCRKCLRKMALTALDDQVLFPVKCCGQEISQKAIITALGSRNRKRYISQLEEYATPPSERLYCPKPNCARWINPKHRINRLNHTICPFCKAKICLDCRDLMHDPGDCSYDPDLRSVLDLAKSENWQRCFGCHAIVEIEQGCSHIVCRCRTEFCYLCGGRWRTCNCSDTRVGQENVIGTDDDLDAHIIVAAMESMEWTEEN